MDTSSKKPLRWASLLRIGSHTYPATFLVIALAAFAAAALLPVLHFVFGTGVFAAWITAFLLFLTLVPFRHFIFRSIYRNTVDDGDTALIEYLVQHNVSGVEGEEETEMELLENAMHLRQVRAYECMTPRPDIVHIDVSASVEDLRERFISSGFSRIPVTEGELDKVLGYIHVQQCFSPGTSLRDMAMPLTFVPESIQVSDLLHKFIQNRSSLAGVVDEYGSLSGLVSLEDALEQLFGDIDDEHDEAELTEVCISDREYLFAGRLDVEYLNEKYPELELPTGDYNTLSGMIVFLSQTIPEQGFTLELDGKKFLLEQVSDRKIELIRVIMEGEG
jgi:putative hemolysin